jgi:hypothetical protein
VTDSNAWGDAVLRLADGLDDPDRLFTHAEASFILSAAEAYGRSHSGSQAMYRAGWDAGYLARVAEENAAYPPEPYGIVTTPREDMRLKRRREADVVAPREEDFAGLGIEAVERLRSDAV